MPIEDIKEIRLFPPLAIGRFGSADSPMDNYDLADGDSITSRRTVVPAETLIVEQGRIVRAEIPDDVTFRDASDRIRPVCPFIEVWARFEDDGSFRPLTKDDVPPESIHWMVSVANRKVQRRTRVANDTDLITATVTIEGSDHQVKELDGTATNFLPGKTIPLGNVQYIEPTDDFPEHRLRFRPGHGNVYGFEENDFVNADRVVYDTSPGKGTWHLYDREQDNLSPVPSDTYRAGILDDSCDGIVEVAIPGTSHSALARISSGPPDFSPDSFHVLTAKDQFMQLLAGPAAATPTDAEERGQLVREVVSLLQRALDTVRLMNTGFLNIEYYSHIDPILGRVGAYDPARADQAHVVSRHEAVLSAVGGLTSADPAVFRAAQQFLPLVLARRARLPDWL